MNWRLTAHVQFFSPLHFVALLRKVPFAFMLMNIPDSCKDPQRQMHVYRAITQYMGQERLYNRTWSYSASKGLAF